MICKSQNDLNSDESQSDLDEKISFINGDTTEFLVISAIYPYLEMAANESGLGLDPEQILEVIGRHHGLVWQKMIAVFALKLEGLKLPEMAKHLNLSENDVAKLAVCSLVKGGWFPDGYRVPRGSGRYVNKHPNVKEVCGTW